MVLSIVAVAVVTAFAALAVDWGRMQLAKLELQNAADAAARQGALSLGQNPLSAYEAARSIAYANTCAGEPVVIDWARGDAQAGHWNGSKFKPLWPTDPKVNAVQIVARRTGPDALPTYFAGLFGKVSVDVSAKSVAVRIPPVSSRKWIPATSNPWLAGMPKGTTANPANPHSHLADFIPDTVGNPSKAPAPILINDVPIEPGQTLTFDSIDGGADHDKTSVRYGPDGKPVRANNQFAYGKDNRGTGGREFGKSDVYAPINAVMGVFLTDAVPTDSGAPPALDFWTDPASREFKSLSPRVAQVFFIGDGKTKDGTAQNFIVPAGATRLFIGLMDQYEWANNQDGHTTTITRPAQVYMVE